MTRPPSRHRHEGSAVHRNVVVLGSQDYTAHAAAHGGELPYRIDLLADSGIGVRWTDGHLRGALGRGRTGRWVRRSEALLTPWAQAWASRRHRRDADAVLAIFESEGHGLAARRLLPWGAASRTPLVIVACWLADLLRSGGRVRRAVYRRLYRRVDRVVVFSANQRATLAQLGGIDPARIEVVRFGVDLDELSAVPTTDGGAVVAAGRDLGRDWTTLAVAADGTGWTVELITRASQLAGLDLPDEVIPLGMVDRPDYLRRLAAATVVAIPTEVREYPTGQTVLLEAMALGKACVVTDTPAMREYVEDGRTGVLVAPHDPAALRAAVARLLDDPDERRRIGDAARSASAAGGGAAAMWRRIGQVVHAVADGREPPPEG